MADAASAEGRTDAAVIQRIYRRMDATLPQWTRTAMQWLQRRREAIRITDCLPKPIRFRLALKKLQRAKSNIYDRYERRRHEYRAVNADAEQLRELNESEVYELCAVDEKIHQLHSQHVVWRAERYLLPVPALQDPNSEWEVGRITGGLRLRREALVALLSATWVEQKQRREAAQANLVWIAASTGVLGAITGLVAVLTH